MNYILTVSYVHDDPVELTAYVHDHNYLMRIIYSFHCDLNVMNVCAIDSTGNTYEFPNRKIVKNKNTSHLVTEDRDDNWPGR